MIVAKVVDASALAAVLFGEAQPATIATQLDGAPSMARALLAFELANVCLTKLRRHPQLRAATLEGYALRGRFDIEEAPMDQGSVVALAAEPGLSACDATYLWLARRHGAELVTLDRRLAASANAP